MKRFMSLATLTLGIGSVGNAFAGGIALYEMGQEGAGTANAGAAVITHDPSVLASNPAGISQLKGTQINANGQLLFTNFRFSRDSANTASGNEGGNPLSFAPGGSFFISHQIDDRSSVGFGMFSTVGLAPDYDDDWAGRYFNRNTFLATVNFQPTYAYKINDDLSVGIGPRIVYGYYKNETAINNNILGFSGRDDGEYEVKDGDVSAAGSIGFLYNLNTKTKLGMTYTSNTHLNIKDSPEITGVNNPLLVRAFKGSGSRNLDADIEIPQTVLASMSYQLNSQWTLLGSANWEDWSQFGKIGVDIDGASDGSTGSVNADRNYKDTWQIAGGAQYQYNKKTRISMGISHDSSMVDDSDRTVDNITGAGYRFSTGINYDIDKTMSVHANYTLDWLGDMDVSQTKTRTGSTVSGTYKNSALSIFGAGVTWRF